MRLHSRLGFALALMGIFLSGARAQEVDALAAAPWATDAGHGWLLGEGCRIEGAAAGGRLDLWSTGAFEGHFSLTGAGASIGGLWFGAGALGLPSSDLGIKIDAFRLPAIAEGYRFRSGPWSASLAMANAFIPELTTSYSSLDFTIAPQPTICLGGSLGYEDLSLSLAWARESGDVFINRSADSGSCDLSLGAAALGWKDWGLLCGYASGEACLTVKSWLSTFADIPWMEWSGSLDALFAAGWGRLSLGAGQWRCSLEGALGLVWSGGSAIRLKRGRSSSTTTDTTWTLGAGPSGLAIAHPSIEWRPAGSLQITLGRWLPFAWGWSVTETSGLPSTTSTGGGTSTGGSTSTGGGSSTGTTTSSLSAEELLLSGLELRISYKL
jgi:hypothetical protein